MAKLRLVKDDKICCTNCNTYKDSSEFYKSNQKKNTLGLTYICIPCSKKKIHEYRNTETGFWVGLWGNLSHSAKKRGLDVEITKEDVIALWEKQKGLCAVTGLPMEKVKATKTTRNRYKNLYRASVDRINSDKGYTKENIRLVCSHVNIMKMDLTDEQFKFWCDAILKGMKHG